MKKNIFKLVKDKQYILILITLFIFIFILINVLKGTIVSFDTSMYNLIISLKSNFMTGFFRTITRFGDEEILILIAIICLVVIKNRKIGVSIAINLASVGLINHILKEIIQRPRPAEELRMVQESSFSFPSGHAMASLAFYGLIICFVYKNVKNTKFKYISCTFLSILIFFIGVSRIYLGVHYTSDVLAGFLFSIAYLIIYTTIVFKLLNIKQNEK